MSDDLVKRLRDSCYVAFDDGTNDYSCAEEAADRIENLEEEVDILISASIRLASRIDIDSNAHADRIEKLEAVLRELSDGWECCPVSQAMRRVARNALESDNG